MKYNIDELIKPIPNIFGKRLVKENTEGNFLLGLTKIFRESYILFSLDCHRQEICCALISKKLESWMKGCLCSIVNWPNEDEEKLLI